MPEGFKLGAKELASVLSRTERDIRLLARAAKDSGDRQEWPVLRDRTTGEPIKDNDGWSYAVVTAPPDRQGRPSKKRAEDAWTFRRVHPPHPRLTTAQRYLLPGNALGHSNTIIEAVAAEAGIVAGAPVRALGDPKPGEPIQVVTADSPGPVLGMLLRPESWQAGRSSSMGDRAGVLVDGTLLLPAAGPIGMGPGDDHLLWDPEARSWRGVIVEGRGLLELFGGWALDCSSDGAEPVVVNIYCDRDLQLDWVRAPES
jgi:hypothetical protein